MRFYSRVNRSNRAVGNAAAFAIGPINDEERETLAGFMGLSRSTVAGWFRQAGGRARLIPPTALDTLLCEFQGEDDFDSDKDGFVTSNFPLRDRCNLAYALTDAGIEREAGYHAPFFGQESENHDLLYEACMRICNIISGQEDDSSGWRISKAWYRITVRPGENFAWETTVYYQSRERIEGSDPDMPCEELTEIEEVARKENNRG